MAKKYLTYWYQEGPEFRAAYLYNVRDDDIRSGGRIEQGQIVQGAEGLVVAESTVIGHNGRIVEFQPNHRCKWKGFELPCMTLAPGSQASAKAVRLGALNYAVVPVTSDAVKATADSLKIPCIKHAQGTWLFNVELTRFSGQFAERRATLI
jgi:hypothetical protein